MMQVQQQQREVDLFLDSIASEKTKQNYEYQLKRFQKSVDIKADDTKEKITFKIIKYLATMKGEGLSYGYRAGAYAAIKHYYEMNDTLLNWKKISKFLGEKTNACSIRGYTHEEIGKLLSVADLKYRAIILTYASTGMRREALTGIKLTDMEYLEEYKLYKIRVYRKTEHEHIWFTTPEAAKAINVYLNNKMKRKYKRIKDDFYFHNIQPENITDRIRNLSLECGIGHISTITENSYRRGMYRDAIPSVHGFRKFAITQMAKARVDVEIAKLLTDHTIDVRGKYLDYTDDDLLQEYLKAIDLLTINEENRLKIKVRELEEREDAIMELKLEMDKLKEMMTITKKEKT